MKNTQKSRPTHAVYVVEGDKDNAYWTKLGAAWAHEDGDGLNIILSALPLSGKLVVRIAKTDKAEAGQ